MSSRWSVLLGYFNVETALVLSNKCTICSYLAWPSYVATNFLLQICNSSTNSIPAHRTHFCIKLQGPQGGNVWHFNVISNPPSASVLAQSTDNDNHKIVANSLVFPYNHARARLTRSRTSDWTTFRPSSLHLRPPRHQPPVALSNTFSRSKMPIYFGIVSVPVNWIV